MFRILVQDYGLYEATEEIETLTDAVETAIAVCQRCTEHEFPRYLCESVRIWDMEKMLTVADFYRSGVPGKQKPEPKTKAKRQSA